MINVKYEELVKIIHKGEIDNFCEEKLFYFDYGFLKTLFNTQLIYFLFNKDKIVYIGQTMRMGIRILSHQASKKKFDRWSCVEVHKNEVDNIEAELIQLVRPIYNIQYPWLDEEKELVNKSKIDLFMDKGSTLIKNMTYKELLEKKQDKNILGHFLWNKFTNFNCDYYNDLYNNNVIYFLLKDDVVNYIGRTSQFLRRLKDHIYTEKSFNSICFCIVEKEEARDIEAVFIRLYKPPENKRIPILKAEKGMGKKMQITPYIYRRQYNTNDSYTHDPEYCDLRIVFNT